MTSRILLSCVAVLCGAALAACGDPSVAGAPPGEEGSGQATSMVEGTAAGADGRLFVREGTFTAQSATKPWSSWWLPLWDDFLFAPRDGEPAPLQRYDSYTSRALNRPTSAAAYEHDKLYVDHGDGWAGRCSAWAFASILAPEPRAPVDRGGVHFRVSDLKALLVESFDNVEGITQIGVRNRGLWSDDFMDIHPDRLHRVLQAELFQGGRPLIIDTDPGAEVWSLPVYRVTTIVTRDRTRSDLVHVRTFLTGASAHVDDLEYVGTLDEKHEYDYDLRGAWYDGGWFLVTGGEWTGSSRQDHPDYVIVMPHAPVQRSSLNTEIDVATVQKIVGP
ncbi:MAG: hypothetical protein QM820_29375 [Minicystis sp.]